MNPTTVYSALTEWLQAIKRSKSKTTWKTYSSAASVFKRESITSDKPLKSLTPDDYDRFLAGLKAMNPRTEKLYAVIIGLFYEYLSAKSLCKVNMDAIRYARRTETRRVGKRLRKMDFPALSEIASKVMQIDPKGNPIVGRARAFVTLLLRSGLRASEAATLRIENLNARKMQGTVIGKGDKEARFIFDAEFLVALREYHSIRKIKSPYLFVSHSRRHGKTPHPIDYDTARRDVILIARLILADDPEFPITPHQFRHYFVNEVWQSTGDIKLAQTLARHDNIATTDRYIHAGDADISNAASKLKRDRSSHK